MMARRKTINSAWQDLRRLALLVLMVLLVAAQWAAAPAAAAPFADSRLTAFSGAVEKPFIRAQAVTAPALTELDANRSSSSAPPDMPSAIVVVAASLAVRIASRATPAMQFVRGDALPQRRRPFDACAPPVLPA